MLAKMWRANMTGRWHLLVMVILAQFLNCLMSLWLPTLNAEVINKGVVPGDIAKIWSLGGIMLAVSVLQVVGMVATAYFAGKTAMWIGRDIRQSTYETVLGFGSAELRAFSPASLITRATNDVNQVQNVIFMTFLIIIQAPIMGIGALSMAVLLDAPLSLLFLVVVPVLLVLMGIIMKFMAPLFRLQQTRIDEVAARTRVALTGVRVVRAFGRKDFMDERFSASNQALKSVALRIGNLFALMIPLVQLVVAVSSVAVVWFGAARYSSGGMEIGDIVAFLTYLMQILGSVIMAAMLFVMVPRAEVCARRLQEILDTKPQVSSPALDSVDPPSGALTLAFHDVALRFPGADRPLLEAVNLVMEPGRTTAIIGSTGTGKSTLLRLLLRSIDPTGGTVTVNGIDLRDLDLDEWHKRVAVVLQNNYLFSGTVATTVAGLEAKDLTPEIRQRVELALQRAQAMEFVARLDDGMDSKVSEGGKNFSGGQRQRLAVARALYREAPVLVLDDPFSALDYATEAALRQELARLGENVTKILVAQRVASVRHADQIVVLDEGRVVGIGTHDSLLQSCETYQEIVESQLSLEEVL